MWFRTLCELRRGWAMSKKREEAKKREDQPTLPTHGAAMLPSVEVDSYNLEISDAEGFYGDRASKRAFWEIVDKWRKTLREEGEDPFGGTPTDKISKKQLEALLAKGDPEAAGVVQSAVEEFAQRLAKVIRRFLRHRNWQGTECIVVGGGFRGSRLGELAVGRAGLVLKADDIDVDLELIANDPDEAGLIGAAHLLPAWMLNGYEAIVAVDVGGTNIRSGLVQLNLKKASDLSRASVGHIELWRHSEEELKRREAVEGLTDMLRDQIKQAAKERLKLAPVIALGCPGVIEPDGSIDRGAQNLPGDWTSSKFNLPRSIREAIPKIGDHETMVVMHNDAVVQGLSELPNMQDRKHWAVLTIGTGLGNARFSNRKARQRRAA
jgi:predicted NBD/HSP70 family sugar kinase